VDYSIFSDKWAHIAVVFEYPRCRFYCNGKLVRDGYMPLKGIANRSNHALLIGKKMPMDLDEFRMYRRALTAQEVAAHYRGKDSKRKATAELALEPHWYEKTLTLRLSCKGNLYKDVTGELVLDVDGLAPKMVSLTPAFAKSNRYVASAAFNLEGLVNQKIKATAYLRRKEGELLETITENITLTKPDWVYSLAGRIKDKVLSPWTPVKTQHDANSNLSVDVWGRRYEYAGGILPTQIKTGSDNLLASAISLTGSANGKEISWQDRHVDLKGHNDIVATLKQSQASDAVAITIDTSIEFDGYVIFDCEVRAKQDISLDELTLTIPLKSKYAQLCYGDRVLPVDPKKPISEFYSGAVRGDLAFRFGPTIWLGTTEKGLCWQSESDRDWHNSDRAKVIEILPRGDTTYFHARFVDVQTKLKEGETLRYKFALQATPIKPLKRDSWDLRVARHEPYGRPLEMPDRKVDGKPVSKILAESGVRHVVAMLVDRWPYPMPISTKYTKLQHRLEDHVHANGLEMYHYMIHERFPAESPEFDIYGMHMSQRPMKQYMPASNPPGSPRMGAINSEYGSGSQGTIFMCSNSDALVDAYIHALAKRMDAFDDDGVYLDGTMHCPPCKNPAHGCGYMTADGKRRDTYPVFSVRRMMQRIYAVVKKRKPDGVVDAHCSWGYNPPGLAYADIMWTGEQWYHLRHSGAKDGYVAGVLDLDMFRTEFLGTQVGIAADTLSYRLGTRMKVAASLLLHDVPVRPNTTGLDQRKQELSANTNYTRTLMKIWKVRDHFPSKETTKLFYWDNQEYVSVSPAKCYSTLLTHQQNGVLAFVTNLTPDAQAVDVELNLKKLGIDTRKLDVINVLSGEPIKMDKNGKLTLPLESEQWTYLWLRPETH
jgi:hypothetical protein